MPALDTREVARHIDLIEDMLTDARAAVGAGHECSTHTYVDPTGVPYEGCRCACHDAPGTDLEREQALTASQAAMRKVANVQ